MASATSPPSTAVRPLPQVDGVTHRYVDAGGLRVHLAEAGDPDAPPLLMLHGWPQHWYMWRKQIPALSQEFRLVMPDLRGFGWTDAPPTGYDKQTLADDALALLDALELDRVKLLAHDWGAWAGFLLSMHHPERIERYMALNMPPPWVPFNFKVMKATPRMFYQLINASPWVGYKAVQPGSRYLAAMFGRASAQSDTWDATAIETFSAQFGEPARARASQLLYRTFVGREFFQVAAGRAARARLTVPTRLVFGEDDFAIPLAFLEGDHDAHADDFEVELVPGCGHFIAEEQPVLVTNRALAFLGR